MTSASTGLVFCRNVPWPDLCWSSARVHFWQINTLKIRQNCFHFADDFFKRMFLNENVKISIRFSLKIVPKGPIDNKSAMVHKWLGVEQATSHYLNQWWLVYWHIYHDDVIKWKHFPRYWPFVRGIHRSPVNSLHKGQWRGALMFSLICVWINDWVNNGEAGDLRHYRFHYDVTVMCITEQWVQACLQGWM